MQSGAHLGINGARAIGIEQVKGLADFLQCKRCVACGLKEGVWGAREGAGKEHAWSTLEDR